MKFVVTMKDPDGVDDSLKRAVNETRPEGLTDDEWVDLAESRRDKFFGVMAKWFEYGEYLRVEVDVDAGTIRVLTNGERC